MNLTKFSIEHGTLINFIVFLVFVGGLFSYSSLGRLEDPDFTVKVGVIITDSVGRPWRIGTIGLAIGVHGVPSVWDLRGDKDLFGRELMVSEEAIADELAAAASLLQGQAAEGRPIVLARGFKVDAPNGTAKDLVRPKDEDMFR